jgi:hypothetical protein
MEQLIKKMYLVADSFVEKLKKVDILHIVESIEKADERTAKMIDDLNTVDRISALEHKHLKTNYLHNFKNKFLRAFT